MMTNREKLKGMGLLEPFLKNTNVTNPFKEEKTLTETLRFAFVWSSSPDGYCFWQYIFKCLWWLEIEERKNETK